MPALSDGGNISTCKEQFKQVYLRFKLWSQAKVKYHSSNWTTGQDNAVEEVSFIIRTWKFHFFNVKNVKEYQEVL